MQGAVCGILACACSFAAAGADSIKAACGVDDGFFAPWRKTVLERRAGWLAKAEDSKPRLFSRKVVPAELVMPVADAKAYQGWKMAPVASAASALNRPLSPGDEFIFDFGEHLVGRLTIGLSLCGKVSDAPVRLRVTFAEMPCELAEDMATAKPSLAASWFQDETFTFDDVPSVNELSRRYAFRYVRIKVTGCPAAGRVGLGDVHATAVTSADETALRAWTAPSSTAAQMDRIACRTLRDCMQTVFEDGPKRDRRLWLGDLRLEALADYETYRNFGVVKRSLHLLAGTCGDSGLVNSDAYERPVPRSGGCRILDYTAIYAATVREYLEASGDRATAEDLWPLCVMQLYFFLDPVRADGVFRDDGKWWCFIDHCRGLDRQTGEQGAIIYGLKATWRLAEMLGRTGDVAFIPDAIAKMEQGARAKLWDEAKGLFVCEKQGQASFLGQAWMVLSGVAEPATAQRCLKAVLADSQAVRPKTPYANHYFTEALYAAGLKREGDAHLLSCWGKMAEFGADTFWEVFDPEDHRAGPYRTPLMNSYCHAWSCAPAYFLRNGKFRALAEYTAPAATKKDDGIPAEASPAVVRAVAASAARPHPRLFTDAAGFAALKSRLGKEELLTSGAEFVRAAADALLGTKPVERIQEGRRILAVSRKALYRINTLALAYRLYGDKAHLERAVAEMRAVCAFRDWNPSHFLDTAEMTLAVAVGYDWLYGDMAEAERREIAAGLRRCGLEASREWADWVRYSHNWGQVCHAGILAGALALAEDDPSEAARFVQRCIDNLPRPMAHLAPDGNYPEGPSYWNYGLEFNVVALALLEDTLGSDFGLAALPGFRETAAYPDLMTGPSGTTFNYCDGSEQRAPTCALWWFARRFGNPKLLAYYERDAFRRLVADRTFVPGRPENRMLPYALLWMRDIPDGLKPDAPLVWHGRGRVPIVVQRSSWNDADALFVGLKGGMPFTSHGHMDCGSFVLDKWGVRWAVDLGAEKYHPIEAIMGMALWSGRQESRRWTIFRLGTSAHNVPMIDGCQQQVKGEAKVVEVKRDGVSSIATLDLSTLYTNAASVVRSGVMALDGTSYELHDVFSGVRPGGRIRWAMMTRAEPAVDGDRVTLRQDGKSIVLVQTGKQKGAWKIGDGQGPNTWDSPNPGCRQLMFTVPAESDGTAGISVKFCF